VKRPPKSRAWSNDGAFSRGVMTIRVEEQVFYGY